MSFKNNSFWLTQVGDLRLPRLEKNLDTQVVVVGGGIAGVSTVNYLLQYTDLEIVLLEAGKIAHGASGHNAGQVVLYFEKPFHEIASEYGVDKAVAAQKAVFQGWDLLEQAIEKVSDIVRFEKFTGYSGVYSLTQLINHLENKFLRDGNGVQYDAVLVDKNWEQKNYIPAKFRPLITEVDAEFIRDTLETDEYFPVLLASKKGCVNSALFCHETLKSLLAKYPHRLSVFEHSAVSEVFLEKDKVVIETKNSARVTSQKIVLCTNGYENFEIRQSKEAGGKLNRHFHRSVEGLVGYMTGFLSEYKSATAISYFVPSLGESLGSESYYYLTRRTIKDTEQSLVCIGGPELFLPDSNQYVIDTHDPEQAYAQIDEFLAKYRKERLPAKGVYHWHGLMGFTQTRLRYIGPDKSEPNLFYNIGCNGVGILTSVYGGWKIAKLLAGEKFESSVFDPS